VKRRTPNPVIPGKASDRTGTGQILRAALVAIRRRYAGLETDVLAVFDRIPVYALNLGDDEPGVRYGLTPEQLAGTSEDLQAALDRWLTEGRQTNHIVWYEPYVEQAHQLGAAQTVNNLSRLSDAYAAARGLESVVFSEPYRVRVALSKFRSYEQWTSLGAAARNDLAQEIGKAVADGTNPKVAKRAIADRLGVSRSRAELYAQTDITGTLREARMAEADYAAEELGIKTALLWTSAFLPTTRLTHAARHGHTYTTAEVKDFYSRDGNRYRCHCATTECLIDDDGKPILTQHLRKAMATELATWRRSKK
jgi:hypothetical protein